MHNIHDLQFRKDILPLFDFTYNELTRQTLTQWLTDFPESESEILIRQDILKGFLRNEQLFLPFAYSAVEFNEVHGFLNDINNRDPNAIRASSRLHLLFAKKERQQERGRLSQLLLFFQKLFRFYFSGLELNHFPAAFQIRLNRIVHFLSDLQLNEYEQRIRNQGLSIRDMSRLNEILVNKCRNNETQFFWEDLFLFEAYLSISKGIRKNQFNFPRFDEEKISFVDCYHPLIKRPVKNSLLMTERVILLSGPNMSGKSTLLKSIGLCVVWDTWDCLCQRLPALSYILTAYPSYCI